MLSGTAGDAQTTGKIRRVQPNEVHISTPTKTAGFLELENARVRWLLSVDQNDLPKKAKESGQRTFRSITMDGMEIEFSGGFTDLHTIVYRETLAGNGFTLEDARPSIEVAHNIREASIVSNSDNYHPLIK